MKKILSVKFVLPLMLLFFVACNNATDKAAEIKEPKLKEEKITYMGDSVTMNGFVVYDENIEGIRPAVLVVPEWWGLNDYGMMRARELAKLGYIAMAIDMYGNGKTADNPDSAGAFATPFYQNPQMAKTRIEAAIAKMKTYAQTDAANIAAIGYCFGGAMVLNTARMGIDLKAVVSFHGNVIGTPLNKDLLKSKILVCHGATDPFVPAEEVAKFKKEMDSTGVAYTFKEYPDAVHAFTNPNATAMGEKFNIPIKYNAAADTASWKDMKEFLGGVFKK
ncbi:MAG: dienelactone hydrolase family protein [Chitinophagaceae bacterium]|jgi:dienelactone hydrolase|nr:dienelactone hydrolase family protein [Chitinophagaceae bacterium]